MVATQDIVLVEKLHRFTIFENMVAPKVYGSYLRTESRN
jgi:hypothetical protein